MIYNGQLHLFVTGGDHAVYQLFWDGSNWNGWFLLGGFATSGPGASSYVWGGK